MKISYIVNARIPTEKAHGYQIMKMCESFAERGAAVTLYTPNRRNSIKTNPFEYYNLQKIFKIKKFSCIDLLGHLPVDRFWFLLQNFSYALNIAIHFILASRSRIIFTRDEISTAFLILLGFRPVYELHNWSENNFILLYVVKRCRRIVAISQGLRRELIDYGIDENKILVARDAVDLEQFDIPDKKAQYREELNLPIMDRIVLYTGHLYKWKGVYTLADAAQMLPDGYQVIFVGGTNLHIDKFKKYFEGLKIGNIKVIGHVPHELIPKYLKAADCLALPNSAKEKISSEYTSPLKLFEYMASKRPIIASNLPSLREVLTDKSCFYFNPDDSGDLARVINKVLNNPKSAETISNQAFHDVQNYTWDQRAKKILDCALINPGDDSNKWDEYMAGRISSWAPIEKIKGHARGNILDIGCGAGDHLKKLWGLGSLYGIDVTDSVLKKAQKQNENINFIHAPAENLPFNDNFFDLVFSIEVVEHVQNPKKMFKEIQRVLKPGGYFIFQTPNYPIKRIYDIIYFFTGRVNKITDDPTHVNKHSFIWWENLTESFFNINESYARNILLEKKINLNDSFKKTGLGKALGQKIIIVCKNE